MASQAAGPNDTLGTRLKSGRICAVDVDSSPQKSVVSGLSSIEYPWGRFNAGAEGQSDAPHIIDVGHSRCSSCDCLHASEVERAGDGPPWNARYLNLHSG